MAGQVQQNKENFGLNPTLLFRHLMHSLFVPYIYVKFLGSAINKFFMSFESNSTKLDVVTYLQMFKQGQVLIVD